MEKFKKEELLGILPSKLRKTKELTNAQKLVLAQLMVYNRLDFAKANGYFFRRNKDFCHDLGTSEPTLILALGKLEDLGFIERKRGKRGEGASEYKVFTKAIEDYSITKKNNFSQSKIAEMSDRIRVLEDTVLALSLEIDKLKDKNFSTEAESEADTETEAELEHKKLIDKDTLDNNINNKNIIKNNILKENILLNKRNKANSPRTEEEETKGSLDCCFLDSSDFKEDYTYVEELEKILAYDRWDNEEESA